MITSFNSIFCRQCKCYFCDSLVKNAFLKDCYSSFLYAKSTGSHPQSFSDKKPIGGKRHEDQFHFSSDKGNFRYCLSLFQF